MKSAMIIGDFCSKNAGTVILEFNNFLGFYQEHCLISSVTVKLQ